MRSALAITITALFIAASANIFAQDQGFKNAPPHMQMKQMQKQMQQNPQSGPGMMQGGPAMMQQRRNCPMMSGGMQSPGMMQDGMMMRKMFKFERFVISHVPEMEEKLSLRSAKARRLSEMQTDFQKRRIDRKANIQKMMIDLRNMKKNKVSANELERAMNNINSMKTEMCLDVYETANQMMAELSQEQKQNLMDMMKDEE